MPCSENSVAVKGLIRNKPSAKFQKCSRFLFNPYYYHYCGNNAIVSPYPK